jgi:hypothetical protein
MHGALRPRDTEIGQLDRPTCVDQYVGRFDVAMNHAARVGERERRQYLVQVPGRHW